MRQPGFEPGVWAAPLQPCVRPTLRSAAEKRRNNLGELTISEDKLEGIRMVMGIETFIIDMVKIFTKDMLVIWIWA